MEWIAEEIEEVINILGHDISIVIIQMMGSLIA